LKLPGWGGKKKGKGRAQIEADKLCCSPGEYTPLPGSNISKTSKFQKTGNWLYTSDFHYSFECKHHVGLYLNQKDNNFRSNFDNICVAKKFLSLQIRILSV